MAETLRELRGEPGNWRALIGFVGAVLVLGLWAHGEARLGWTLPYLVVGAWGLARGHFGPLSSWNWPRRTRRAPRQAVRA